MENEDLHSGDHVVVKNLKFINVTLSFGRLRQRIVLKCVPHVQHDYFSSFNQSHRFLAQSLPLPSSLLELETLRNRTAGWLWTAEWRKNVARHCAFPVLRYIFFRHSSALSLLSLMATATTRKRSLENKHLPSYGCCEIIPSCSQSSMLAKYTIYLDWCARRWITYRELKNILLLCSSCQNRKCAKFTLLFCRGHHGIVLKCVSHAYFSVLPACVWLELWLANYV